MLAKPYTAARGRLCASLLALTALSFYLSFYLSRPSYLALRKDERLKYVLLWNDYFKYPNFAYGTQDGQVPFLKANCSVNTCYLTESHHLMPPEDFDAVFFHMYEFFGPLQYRKYFSFGLFPPNRRPNQVYVFYLRESPKMSRGNYEELGGVFNWTLTYRLDSDISEPYGRLIPKEHVPEVPVLKAPSSTVLPHRSNPTFVVWLVSNCQAQSKRERYVRELSKYINVDIYGDCGIRWPKEDLGGFYHAMQQQYKFYLSFENSLCKDYITEKFFNVLRYKFVPVVLGEGNYSALAPPVSYIDVRDFPTPKQLANYLVFLDQHPEEYAKYFWWKKFYTFQNVRQHTLCRLCEKLHAPVQTKVYDDIKRWWMDGTCKDPS